MNEALQILRRERSEAADQIRVLKTRIRGLDQAIGVLEGQPVQAAGGRAPGDFKLSVLTKLRELAALGGTAKELAEAFVIAGRTTSEASVSSTLSRLKAESLVTNRSGRWFAAKLDSDSQDTTVSERELVSISSTDWDDLDEEPPF